MVFYVPRAKERVVNERCEKPYMGLHPPPDARGEGEATSDSSPDSSSIDAHEVALFYSKCNQLYLPCTPTM
jgi:hypothetical protein